MLTEAEIRSIVRKTLREEREEYEEALDRNVLKTMAALLSGFGIDEEEKKEIKEDFRYLRRWRKGSDKVTGVGLTALVTLVVGGFASALWLGIQSMIGGKH